ncbi:MAG: twin-arginine translocation signal domain-containing protein, partial [Cyclobacteriaceae bacterium]|nr:twin-arginine translocation signal domain-containing protein [Cyclobacteriaceae bacterium]
MNRRDFITTASAGAVAMAFTDSLAFQSSRPGLIFDAMGEIRTIYTMELIDQIIGSGLNAITITLTDPKPVGADSLKLLLEDIEAYDRYFEAHPDRFIRAVSVRDVDR